MNDKGTSKLSIRKETHYTYSNVIVAVFAMVVLGVLVTPEEVSDHIVTDKLIVRLDTLGYLHAMHELGEWDEFRKTVDEYIGEGKPWNECLSILSHMTLFYFDGAEGLVRRRNDIREQADDEARSGISRKNMIREVIKHLVGDKSTDEVTETPVNTTVN